MNGVAMFLKLGSTNGDDDRSKRRFPLCCFKKDDAYDFKANNNNET